MCFLSIVFLRFRLISIQIKNQLHAYNCNFVRIWVRACNHWIASKKSFKHENICTKSTNSISFHFNIIIIIIIVSDNFTLIKVYSFSFIILPIERNNYPTVLVQMPSLSSLPLVVCMFQWKIWHLWLYIFMPYNAIAIIDSFNSHSFEICFYLLFKEKNKRDEDWWIDFKMSTLTIESVLKSQSIPLHSMKNQNR